MSDIFETFSILWNWLQNCLALAFKNTDLQPEVSGLEDHKNIYPSSTKFKWLRLWRVKATHTHTFSVENKSVLEGNKFYCNKLQQSCNIFLQTTNFLFRMDKHVALDGTDLYFNAGYIQLLLKDFSVEQKQTTSLFIVFSIKKQPFHECHSNFFFNKFPCLHRNNTSYRNWMHISAH